MLFRSYAPEMASWEDAHPEWFSMTEYELSVMPGLICHYTNCKIDKVSPRLRVGHVFSFNVTPWQMKDPTFILCNFMDMTIYNKLWGRVMREHTSMMNYLDEYQDGMRAAIRSARGLTRPEVLFAILEMLRFKNEAVR